MTKDNPKGRGQSRAGGKTTGADRAQGVNPTANTSLTPPGPAPKSMESRRAGRGGADAGSQFGQESRSGQGADLTEQMDAAGPDTGGGSSEPDLIPWDPTGKIDDEVERRTRQPAGSGGGATGPSGGGSPSTGGGQTGLSGGVTGRGGQAPADTGYGGGAETLSVNRYADATDNAPTDPEEGATTTLASLAAEDQDATGSAAGSLRKSAAPRKGQPTAPRKAPPGSTEVH